MRPRDGAKTKSPSRGIAKKSGDDKVSSPEFGFGLRGYPHLFSAVVAFAHSRVLSPAVNVYAHC